MMPSRNVRPFCLPVLLYWAIKLSQLLQFSCRLCVSRVTFSMSMLAHQRYAFSHSFHQLANQSTIWRLIQCGRHFLHPQMNDLNLFNDTESWLWYWDHCIPSIFEIFHVFSCLTHHVLFIFDYYFTTAKAGFRLEWLSLAKEISCLVRTRS